MIVCSSFEVFLAHQVERDLHAVGRFEGMDRVECRVLRRPDEARWKFLAVVRKAHGLWWVAKADLPLGFLDQVRSPNEAAARARRLGSLLAKRMRPVPRLQPEAMAS